jgi:outer membrane protein assembly factor BamB
VPKPPRELLYVGIKRHVLALDAASGELVWEAELGGSMPTSSVVAVHAAAGRVFASSGGEVYCLDAGTGARLWHNELTGLGLGFAALATAGGGSDAASAAAATSAR